MMKQGGIQASSEAEQYKPTQIHPDKKTSALGRGFFQSEGLKDVGELLKRIPDVMANNIGTTSKGGNKQAEAEQLDVAGSVVRYPNVGLGTPHRISRCRSGKGCPGR